LVLGIVNREPGLVNGESGWIVDFEVLLLMAAYDPRNRKKRRETRAFFVRFRVAFVDRSF